MILRMNGLQRKKVLVVGDFRTKGYAATLRELFEVQPNICQFNDLSHQDIALRAEDLLNTLNPDILIIISLCNDLIQKVQRSHFSKPLFHQKESFNPILALQNMKYYNDKWRPLYQDLIIIWTIPDVPNLITFNGENIHWKERMALIRDEKDIYNKLKIMKDNWKSIFGNLQYNALLLPLRNLTVNDIKDKISEPLSTKYIDSRVWHNYKTYSDGINPLTTLAELFSKEIHSLVNSILAIKSASELSCKLQPVNVLSLPPSSEGNYRMDSLKKDILRKLWERHKIEYYNYRIHFESHPSYERERAHFMEQKAKQMAFEGVYPTANTLEAEWLHYWKDKLEIIFLESWEAKKVECLEILNSSHSQDLSLPSSSFKGNIVSVRDESYYNTFASFSHNTSSIIHGTNSYYSPTILQPPVYRQNRNDLFVSHINSSVKTRKNYNRDCMVGSVGSQPAERADQSRDRGKSTNILTTSSLQREIIGKDLESVGSTSILVKEIDEAHGSISISANKELLQRSKNRENARKCIVKSHYRPFHNATIPRGIVKKMKVSGCSGTEVKIDSATEVKIDSGTEVKVDSGTEVKVDSETVISDCKYSMEELISKFERYNALPEKECQELDEILQKLEESNEVLAASLNVLKNQSASLFSPPKCS